MVSALKKDEALALSILQLASCACAGINCMLPQDIHMTHLHTPLDSCIDSCLSIVTQLRNCHLSICLTVDFFSILKKEATSIHFFDVSRKHHVALANLDNLATKSKSQRYIQHSFGSVCVVIVRFLLWYVQ